MNSEGSILISILFKNVLPKLLIKDFVWSYCGILEICDVIFSRNKFNEKLLLAYKMSRQMVIWHKMIQEESVGTTITL